MESGVLYIALNGKKLAMSANHSGKNESGIIEPDMTFDIASLECLNPHMLPTVQNDHKPVKNNNEKFAAKPKIKLIKNAIGLTGRVKPKKRKPNNNIGVTFMTNWYIIYVS